MRVIEPEQAGQNTTMAGMPPGTLTLELPIQRPPGVVVPVVELHLAPSDNGPSAGGPVAICAESSCVDRISGFIER